MIESRLILDDYHLVESGEVRGGDKYWDPDRLAWIPVTVNDCRDCSEFAAVIRKGE